MALPTAGTGAEQDQFWPMPKFYFSVDIGDMTDLPFQEVSGLEVETEMIEYRHGNSPNHSKIKMPGLLKYADVTLKKGVFADDNQFYEWMSQISLNTYERLTVVIRLLDETATPIPKVWSDKPMLHLNFFFKSTIVFKFESFGEAG